MVSLFRQQIETQDPRPQTFPPMRDQTRWIWFTDDTLVAFSVETKGVYKAAFPTCLGNFIGNRNDRE